MGRCMILFPNRADPPKGAMPGSILSGPEWQLPLANLQDRRSSRLARSVDTDPANTQFDLAMTAQKPIRAVVLVRHNLSVTAHWRITAWYDDQSFDEPDFQLERDVYSSLSFTEDLAWEDENWWDGRPLSEDLEGFAQNAIMVLPSPVSAPNWRIEIFDEGNPDGYVEARRLFMADGWQPSHNYAYGGSLRYETLTRVETSLGGAEFFDRREAFRVASIGFDYLPQDEALSKGLDLCRRAGIDGQLFWIADPDDDRNITRLSFMGRLRQLAAWEQVVFERANIGFEIKEIL